MTQCFVAAARIGLLRGSCFGLGCTATISAIIVNREVLDWIRLARDEEVARPNLPAETGPDPRAKDLTGHIRTWRP